MVSDIEKRSWLESTSALRILLHYPETTMGVGQFKSITIRDTRYIYNERTENIIAAIRSTSKGLLVRYRPTSWYAYVFKDYGKWTTKDFSGTYYILPSSTLSRHVRPVRRTADTLSETRGEVLKRIHGGYFFDNITMTRYKKHKTETNTLETSETLDLTSHMQSYLNQLHRFGDSGGNVTIAPSNRWEAFYGRTTEDED